MKSLDASLISAKMFLNAAHPSSRVLPAGTIMVLLFLLTEASDTCRLHSIRPKKLQEPDYIQTTRPAFSYHNFGSHEVTVQLFKQQEMNLIQTRKLGIAFVVTAQLNKSQHYQIFPPSRIYDSIFEV